MNTDDLERLLQQKNADKKLQGTKTTLERSADGPQKADKSATLYDFIDMVAMLVGKIMKDPKVEFIPDEGARPSVDPAIPLEAPTIYYDVVERSPKLERKPRVREELSGVCDEQGEKRQVSVWGQKFSCIIQFNLLACDYRTANAVMHNFEKLIFGYTPYFKRNGVAEILFKKHFSDKNLNIFRQNLSVRSLQYYVEIERLMSVYEAEIKEITIVAK